MSKKATFINKDMLEPYVCDENYTSIMVMGDELVGEHCINLNQGIVKGGGRLPGAAHEKAELYYIVKCDEGAEVVTGLGDEEVHHKVKANDIMYIPGGCHHWINNTMCEGEFIIMTMWPDQADNECYHARLKDWGTSFRFKK